MFRVFSSERGRQKQRLELSLAGICELELLKRRHQALIISALGLHTPDPPPEQHWRPAEHQSPRGTPESCWSLMKLLQHQVGELKVDTENSSSAAAAESCTEDGERTAGAGFSEAPEGPLDSSVHGEISWRAVCPVPLTERPKSAGDVCVGGVRTAVPRSLSAPYPPLEGIAESIAEDEPWIWQPSEDIVEKPTTDDYRQAQHVETYILGLIQRRSPPARPNKPRTSLSPEPRAVIRQSSLNRKEPPFVQEKLVWAEDECAGVRYPRMHTSTSLDFPCGALDPSSSEAESPQHFYQHTHTHSPSSDELVNAQYIPAQPCRAQARPTTYKSPKSSYSPERKPRATPKKCRFTEDKNAQKKPGRKACRAQSENSLLGQRGVLERRYNTVERDAMRSVPKARRSSGRRWRSTQELSQDEAETPNEQPIRRSRRARPICGYTHPTAHPPPQPHLREYTAVQGESESSLSEAESPGSSSLSSDSDGSGGLVWPQQLHPQPAPTTPSHPPAHGHDLQPKAFVKIKASHALKKKILRFRSGSLKVMTTV